MLARVRSGALTGIEAVVVEVEVDLTLGLPFFNLVGLPEGAVRESKVRVLSAIRNADYVLPQKRITVNLAPADIRKDGTAFDLPIALGILVAAGALDDRALERHLFAGELSLDGTIKPIRGALPLAVAARDTGMVGVVVPRANAAEAAVVEGVGVFPADSFKQLVRHLQGVEAIAPQPSVRRTELVASARETGLDFSDVRGQEGVKRAMEVAAAGGHNALLIGPPGSGKTMLAKRLPSVLPEMSFEESLQTSKIYSVAGLMGQQGLIAERPFRSPHHSISDAGLIGGGAAPRPGEVSLAHNGVLFLDELPEFKKNVLEVLRQPLEEGKVTIARAAQSLTFPCQVMLVAAMNPCPCGHAGDPTHECICGPLEVLRYRGRVSGPLLDRIDIHVDVTPVRFRELNAPEGEPSSAVRERVQRARARQRARFARVPGVHCNAQMTPRLLRRLCPLEAEGEAMLARAVDRLGMSARAHDRILRMALTLTDLEEGDRIEPRHVREAIQYRTLDRRLMRATEAEGRFPAP